MSKRSTARMLAITRSAELVTVDVDEQQCIVTDDAARQPAALDVGGDRQPDLDLVAP